jgi:hypothetical protein
VGDQRSNVRVVATKNIVRTIDRHWSSLLIAFSAIRDFHKVFDQPG